MVNVKGFGGSCVTWGDEGVIAALNAYIGYKVFYFFYLLFELPWEDCTIIRASLHSSSEYEYYFNTMVNGLNIFY